MTDEKIFSQFSGRYEFEINGIELELTFPVEDKLSLVKSLEERDLKKTAEILTEIIQDNYPDEDPKSIKGFVNKKFFTLIEKVPIAFGLASEEELENVKAKVKANKGLK